MKLGKIKCTKYLAILYLNIVGFFKWTELYQPTYNPKKFYLYKGEKGKRYSDDRLEFIKQNVNFSKANTYLDIGSQLGYFVFKLSENNDIIAQGIEMNYISWAYANSIATLYQKENVSFMKGKLTSMMSESLPNYDIISFLNIFHHIVHFEGFEEANKIMSILAKKCEYFIFETGQFNEKNLYWTDSLNFMGENPQKWIKEYLFSLNYEIIAEKEFPNHLNDKKRDVFICRSKNIAK